MSGTVARIRSGVHALTVGSISRRRRIASASSRTPQRNDHAVDDGARLNQQIFAVVLKRVDVTVRAETARSDRLADVCRLDFASLATL